MPLHLPCVRRDQRSTTPSAIRAQRQRLRSPEDTHGSGVAVLGMVRGAVHRAGLTTRTTVHCSRFTAYGVGEVPNAPLHVCRHFGTWSRSGATPWWDVPPVGSGFYGSLHLLHLANIHIQFWCGLFAPGTLRLCREAARGTSHPLRGCCQPLFSADPLQAPIMCRARPSSLAVVRPWTAL